MENNNDNKILQDLDVFEGRIAEEITNAISDITQEIQESFQKIFLSFKNRGVALEDAVRKNVSQMKTSVQIIKLERGYIEEDLLPPKSFSDQQKGAKDASNAAHILLRKIEAQKSDTSIARNDEESQIQNRLSKIDRVQCEEEEEEEESINFIIEEDTICSIASFNEKEDTYETDNNDEQNSTNDAERVVSQILLHIVDNMESFTKENTLKGNITDDKIKSSSQKEDLPPSRKRVRRDTVCKETFDFNTKIEAPQPNRHETKMSTAPIKVQDSSSDKIKPLKAKRFACGDIVWAFWNHRWYAAKIFNVKDVPTKYKSKLNKIYKRGNPSDYVIVRFFVDGAFSKVNREKVFALGNEAADKAKSKNDVKSYEAALDDLKRKNGLIKEKPTTRVKTPTKTAEHKRKNMEEISNTLNIKDKTLKREKRLLKRNTEIKSEEPKKAGGCVSKISRDDKTIKVDKKKITKVPKGANKEEYESKFLETKRSTGPTSKHVDDNGAHNSYVCGPNIKENDLVIATVRGRKPWPAKVQEVLGNGDCKVTFYGTGNVNYSAGKVYSTKIIKYSTDSKQVLFRYKSDKMKKAIEEITVDLMSRYP